MYNVHVARFKAGQFPFAFRNLISDSGYRQLSSDMDIAVLHDWLLDTDQEDTCRAVHLYLEQLSGNIIDVFRNHHGPSRFRVRINVNGLRHVNLLVQVDQNVWIQFLLNLSNIRTYLELFPDLAPEIDHICDQIYAAQSYCYIDSSVTIA